jgi:hypothetical protein
MVESVSAELEASAPSWQCLLAGASAAADAGLDLHGELLCFVSGSLEPPAELPAVATRQHSLQGFDQPGGRGGDRSVPVVAAADVHR